MTVTCHDEHNYSVGKYVHLSGIGMTCEFSYIDNAGNKQSTIQNNGTGVVNLLKYIQTELSDTIFYK